MKSKVVIAPAEPRHVEAMRGRFRAQDDAECRAASGFSADREAMAAVMAPGLRWTAFAGGEPFCVFGVTPKSMLLSTGCPWLLGTDAVLDNWVGVLKLSRGYVKQMLQPFDKLENYVDARNTVSMKWLKWCGFSFDAAEPYGILGLPFHRFYMTKEV